MKSIGLIGGLGPESTVDYYRSLIETHRSRYPDADPPSIIINSVNMQHVLRCVRGERLHDLAAFLVSELQKLAVAGADFALLTANTPHIVFDEVERASPLPLISIVQATADRAHQSGFRRVGLLGTRFTMQATFYPDVFARKQMQIHVPDENDQAYIHERYFKELVNGVFLDETRQALTEMIVRMKNRDGIQAVILGGTELPLLLRGGEAGGVPLLDTTQIHVEAALERLSS
ncbi:MAG TPA: amino acid racemase [Terriglobales bacterium]|jgi:aspartate racemase|nr:amino acid racemase [Terriglobales bacterium]